MKAVAVKALETAGRARREWRTPEMKTVGTVGQVLAEGGGKPSLNPGDPGEPRKVSAQR